MHQRESVLYETKLVKNVRGQIRKVSSFEDRDPLLVADLTRMQNGWLCLRKTPSRVRFGAAASTV